MTFIQESDKRFDIQVWGLAPEDSLKGKKGSEIKSFIHSEFSRLLDEVRKELEQLITVIIEDGGMLHRAAVLSRLEEMRKEM